MYRCPKCGSTNINQWRSLVGPMLCSDCGFSVEDKMAVPNPFYVADEPAAGSQVEQKPPAMGEQMLAWLAEKRKKKS